VSLRRLVSVVAAAITLSAGVLAGCGAGAASAGSSDTATTTTGAGSGIPGVTTVTVPTIPETELPGYDRPGVLLGDMNTPEQFILGQLYQLALQQMGYQVALSRNIGAPPVRRKALETGSLDLYPEYLGQWNSYMAHLHRRFTTLAASYAAGSAYARKHGFVLLKPTPYSYTTGLAVTSQYAQQNHISSIPDLTHGTGVILGAPLNFQTETDGLPALARAYHLHVPDSSFQPIDVTAQYRWLDSGNVQVAWVKTTDPQLAGPQYRVLADPKHVFGFGNVVPVTTPKVLREEGPAFAQTIDRVDALLTTQAMRGLNAEYLIGGHDPTDIARQFLKGSGILPPSQYAPVTDTTTTTASTSTDTPWP
jgi:osmoprotectant transport system substrate-binding protein